MTLQHFTYLYLLEILQALGTSTAPKEGDYPHRQRDNTDRTCKAVLLITITDAPLQQILLPGAQFNILTNATHLPGAVNGLADALSRNLTEKIASYLFT